jgi:putative membrane protein
MKFPGAIAGRMLLGVAAALFSMISFSITSVGQSSASAAGQEGTMQQGQEGSMSQPQSSAKQSAGMTMSADQKFVREAAEGGMAEVELGKLAAEKGSSQDVKNFGQRMVDDHGKANDQLKQIASTEGITLPTKLDAKDHAMKTRLSKLSGESFDHAYMQNMVKDHKKDIADFQKESTSGSDPAVKQFASQTLPTLQQHLQQAESIAPNTKMSQNNMSSGGSMQK